VTAACVKKLTHCGCAPDGGAQGRSSTTNPHLADRAGRSARVNSQAARVGARLAADKQVGDSDIPRMTPNNLPSAHASRTAKSGMLVRRGVTRVTGHAPTRLDLLTNLPASPRREGESQHKSGGESREQGKGRNTLAAACSSYESRSTRPRAWSAAHSWVCEEEAVQPKAGMEGAGFANRMRQAFGESVNTPVLPGREKRTLSRRNVSCSLRA
jgi:hypothetical protein